MELRNFKYVAVTADGKTIKGKIEALNKGVTMKYLQTKNYTVKSVTEYHNIVAKLATITIGKLLSDKQLIFFLKQLGSLLTAGVTIMNALELLALQQENRHLRKLFFELYQQLYNGFSFSKALSRRPKEFPQLLVQMVEIGELSGDLASTVLKMAEYYEKQLKISQGIKGAMRMPLIYLGAALLISIGMITFVFPSITSLFASFEGAKLPWITQFFLDAGDFMANYALYLIAGIIVIAGLFVFLNRKSEAFHRAVSMAGLKFPVFGKLIQMNNQIMIANSLSQMLSRGIHAVKALTILKGLLKNVIYKELMAKTLRYIEDGKPFSRAFEESMYIDSIMSKMIATGEKTGDIPKLMENLSEYYNGISELRVEQLKNAIQPILLILVYAIVGVMLMAIMLPMISLGSQI